VPCLGRLIRPFPSSTRACGAGVASSFAVGFPSRGGRSRGRDPRRDARVFRPCSRGADPSPGTRHACAASVAGDSLRPSAGGANEEPTARARECRPANRPSSLLATLPASRNQDPDDPRMGLAPSESEPHAPSTASTLLLDHGPTETLGTCDRGARARPCDRLLARSTLAAKRKTHDLVQAGGSCSSLGVAPSYRLTAFLGRTAKMPRNRFYNRRLASRAPVFEERPLRRPFTGRRGKPAGVRLRGRHDKPGVSAFVPVTAPDHLAVIQPPAAHVLDGTVPASGRSATTGRACARCGESAVALSADGRSAELTL